MMMATYSTSSQPLWLQTKFLNKNTQTMTHESEHSQLPWEHCTELCTLKGPGTYPGYKRHWYWSWECVFNMFSGPTIENLKQNVDASSIRWGALNPMKMYENSHAWTINQTASWWVETESGAQWCFLIRPYTKRDNFLLNILHTQNIFVCHSFGVC